MSSRMPEFWARRLAYAEPSLGVGTVPRAIPPPPRQPILGYEINKEK